MAINGAKFVACTSKDMKKHIPNTITLLNLLAGCAATVYILDGQFEMAAWLLLVGGLADFADGLAARALHVHSELGKELDSLADMVSFGLAPGAILYTFINLGPAPLSLEPSAGLYWPAMPAFVVTAFSALRLAKFNLDTRQSDTFLGLATPACTLLVAGLMLIYEADLAGSRAWLGQAWVVYVLAAALSALLVSDLPMFSFKFKSFKWVGNEIRFIFVAVALILLVIWRELALAPIIVVYILLNIAQIFIQKRRHV